MREKLSVVLAYSKTTKSTHVYTNGDVPLSIYLPKSLFASAGHPPSKLIMTVDTHAAAEAVAETRGR